MSDLIDRQVAIEYIKLQKWRRFDGMTIEDAILTMIREVPSAQPEIIFCKDCKKHNIAMGDHLDLGYNKYHWYEKSEVCPLIDMRGKAQGHEFDYQFCAYAERRTDEQT